MQLEEGHLFHIYNQGNNKQKIFFERENYLFFLRKMRVYLLPYCDILAYCLMPNHFHWMVKVNRVTVGVARSDADGSTSKQRTLNDSIGILLRSYTNAINKRYQRSGKLLREKTKAECITQYEGISPSFYTSQYATIARMDNPETEYPQVCFNYIHQNPVAARLVQNAIDWEFSSAKEYAGLRNGTLVNKTVAKQHIVF